MGADPGAVAALVAAFGNNLPLSLRAHVLACSLDRQRVSTCSS